MTFGEASAEAGKYNIADYRQKGVNMYGMTFFPVNIQAMRHPDSNLENYEVMIELELLSSNNIHIPMQEYLALL